MGLEALNLAVSQKPGQRVIHVTNQATAKSLQARATRDVSLTTKTIIDSEALKLETKNQRYTKYVSRNIERAEGAMRAIMSAPTMTVEGVTYGLGGLAASDKHSAVATTNREMIFVTAYPFRTGNHNIYRFEE